MTPIEQALLAAIEQLTIALRLAGTVPTPVSPAGSGAANAMAAKTSKMDNSVQ